MSLIKFTLLSLLWLFPNHLLPTTISVRAQSSSLASAAASASASASSGPQQAQARYLQEVVQTLNANNLTSLVNIATSIANTSSGQTLLAQIAGSNKTLFAPSDAAIARLTAEVRGNTETLTQILAYHFLNGTLDPAALPLSPIHATGPTLLNGVDYRLPGNQPARCVCQRQVAEGSLWQIVQATQNANATWTDLNVNNLKIFVIDSVLDLPRSIQEAGALLFPAVSALAQPLGLLDQLGATPGITLFAPIDSALSSGGVQGALGQLNQIQIGALLGNHVINGSAVYSELLSTGNYTSAAGQPFRFTTNSSGTFVQSANATARVVQSDIITENGVVHLIDRVLINVASDPSAASSAYISASSFANAPAGASASASASASATSSSASRSTPGGISTSAPAATSSRSAAGSTFAGGGVKNMGVVVGLMGLCMGMSVGSIGGAFLEEFWMRLTERL